MIYEPLLSLSRAAALQQLETDDPQLISRTLLASALNDPDRAWAQDQCIRFAHHPDSWVRGTAVICFSHLARLHGQLDLDRVLPLLEELKSDPAVHGRVLDALDDIDTFLVRNTAPDESA